MRHYTPIQQEIINNLEQLVHWRFSKEELVKRVNEIFGLDNKINIDWNCYEDGYLSDYNAMFTTIFFNEEDEKLVHPEAIGDFDIYYLECKQPNDNNQEVYVTEVSFDFQ